VSQPRFAGAGLSPALLATALLAAIIAHGEPAQPENNSLISSPTLAPAQNQSESLVQANSALQAGEADKALALLASVLTTEPKSGSNSAEGHNLICRVRLMLEQWDAAATECEQAVHLDAQNSNYHLWLGRALGEKADHATFLSAFSLAKRTRSEFEEAVHLDPRNAEALSDLGDFYRQAPGVVGGGIDKAQEIASQLDKVDSSRAHQLRGHIAEQQKDNPAAEREFKLALAADPHPGLSWTTLAGFYARRQSFAEMESAIHSAVSAALHDKHAVVALYDGAGLLIEFNRDPALAADLLKDYLASSSMTEEAPAFIAHLRLARLKVKLGDPAAADRERTAALALAHEYKPALDFRSQAATQLDASTSQLAKL
jgi:tetratricopeptide (TPR) repeat protein